MEATLTALLTQLINQLLQLMTVAQRAQATASQTQILQTLQPHSHDTIYYMIYISLICSTLCGLWMLAQLRSLRDDLKKEIETLKKFLEDSLKTHDHVCKVMKDPNLLEVAQIKIFVAKLLNITSTLIADNEWVKYLLDNSIPPDKYPKKKKKDDDET